MDPLEWDHDDRFFLFFLLMLHNALCSVLQHSTLEAYSYFKFFVMSAFRVQ